jgi:threonine/homoserine/homoserine lactone efflux protein
MKEYLFLGITYAFAAAVQPGPFQTYLISQTLNDGWIKTFPAAFAPLISDVPIIALVVLILSNIPGWFSQSLQFFGGLYLLYLAFGTFKNWKNYYKRDIFHSHSSQQTVLKAALVNFLNPNPYLAWSLIMGPLLIKGWQQNPSIGLALLIGFYATLIIVTLGIMLLFAAAKSLGHRVSRTLIGISGLAMTGFGLYEIYQFIFTFLLVS